MDIVSVPRGTVDRARPGQGIQEMKEAGFQNILLDMAEALTPWELEGAGDGKSVKKLDGALIGDPPSVLGESIKLLSGECRKYALQTPIASWPKRRSVPVGRRGVKPLSLGLYFPACPQRGCGRQTEAFTSVCFRQPKGIRYRSFWRTKAVTGTAI